MTTKKLSVSSIRQHCSSFFPSGSGICIFSSIRSKFRLAAQSKLKNTKQPQQQQQQQQQQQDKNKKQNLLCPFVKFYSLSWEVRIVFDFLILFFLVVSLTNIAVISLERFHATFRPFRHRLINRWVYVVAIAVVWVFPVIALVTRAIERFLIIHRLYLVESYCFLCFIVIFVSYTSILVLELILSAIVQLL